MGSNNNIKNIFLLNNVLYINSKYGLSNLNMPNFYFYKESNNSLSLKFDDYHKYNMVFRQIKNKFVNFSKIYFFKLKLRGLGYKIVSYLKRRLIKFFFAYNHFFYLHVPNNVYFIKIKRRFIFFSNNLVILNDLFANLLRLKKMDFYERANTFIVANKILYMKKRK